MKNFYLTIDGKKMAANNTFDVINPSTEEVLAQAPDCSREQFDLAVDAANRAFKSWRKDEAARRRILRECAVVIRSHSEELAELFTHEQRVRDVPRYKAGGRRLSLVDR